MRIILGDGFYIWLQRKIVNYIIGRYLFVSYIQATYSVVIED